MNARSQIIDVLSMHGYADSDVYGACFCGEVHADSGDMAVHILEKLQPVLDLQDERKQTALDALLEERNTWARQLADLRDELDEARRVSEQHFQAKAEAENERDALQLRLEERS